MLSMLTVHVFDVHGRDVVQVMIKQKVSSPGDLEWSKQMRYN